MKKILLFLIILSSCGTSKLVGIWEDTAMLQYDNKYTEPFYVFEESDSSFINLEKTLASHQMHNICVDFIILNNNGTCISYECESMEIQLGKYQVKGEYVFLYLNFDLQNSYYKNDGFQSSPIINKLKIRDEKLCLVESKIKSNLDIWEGYKFNISKHCFRRNSNYNCKK